MLLAKDINRADSTNLIAIKMVIEKYGWLGDRIVSGHRWVYLLFLHI